MAKYHINREGNPGACSAKPGNCPFGSESSHYDTVEEARAAFEASMAKHPAGKATGATKSQAKLISPEDKYFATLSNTVGTTVWKYKPAFIKAGVMEHFQCHQCFKFTTNRPVKPYVLEGAPGMKKPFTSLASDCPRCGYTNVFYSASNRTAPKAFASKKKHPTSKPVKDDAYYRMWSS